MDLPAGARAPPIADAREVTVRWDEPDPPTGLGHGHDPRDRAVPVHDDHLGAVLDRAKMLRQTVLELGDLHVCHGQI